MEGLIEGRIVHYVLTKEDAEVINQRRADFADRKPREQSGWPYGVQGHIGNTVVTGQHCPMVITAVFPGEFQDPDNLNGPRLPGVNGKVLLDGEDTYWVCSKKNSVNKEPGTWHWIERV